MVLHVEEGEVVKVSGDADHPTNFGRLCTKGRVGARRAAPLGAARPRVRAPGARGGPGAAAGPRRDRRHRAPPARGARLQADALSVSRFGERCRSRRNTSSTSSRRASSAPTTSSRIRACVHGEREYRLKQSLGADGPPGSYQDFDRANLFFVIGANMADCHPILFLRMMDRVKAGEADRRRSAPHRHGRQGRPVPADPAGHRSRADQRAAASLHANGRTDAAFIGVHRAGTRCPRSRRLRARACRRHHRNRGSRPAHGRGVDRRRAGMDELLDDGA